MLPDSLRSIMATPFDMSDSRIRMMFVVECGVRIVGSTDHGKQVAPLTLQTDAATSVVPHPAESPCNPDQSVAE